MSLTYTESKEIAYYMCDRHQNLTLPMLVNILLDVSEKQSESLNRDEAFVKARGLSWIILHYEFMIERMPKLKETVQIETYATEYNKLFTYREFVIRDANHKELVRVKTTFALLDSEKRKMGRITEDIVEPYKATFSKRIRRNQKPAEPDLNEYTEKTYAVRYFDIDGNNHVNNSHYINWLLDSLDSEFLSQHDIRHGVITFDKEVNEHQTVISRVSYRKEEELYTDHLIRTNGASHCSASFKWIKVG
ncbi:acyl-[acyl-carrier-protein] thioesterase [Alkalibacterium olivapovliticus]|uniref:Medium-chain acyl-[acyl-carrier-protein] hydrolase n=1 Tax=Alkalibacterium olivapovliticus TaxID=99907 RepID=A0A2T0W9Y1_9LACT|nr:acyl-ACP thioesterase domain-containing protein [Alkalibacterium olivapovliticus]PRY83436.1 medium-chain acyl-[acyl-carrier-protein] hydrolase [Alkalibacterium olivapovliticus]